MKNILKNIMVIILLLAFTTLGFRNESSTKISAVEKKDKYIVFVKQKKEIPMELQSKEVILPELNEEILEEKKIGVVNMTNVEVKKWEKSDEMIVEKDIEVVASSKNIESENLFGVQNMKALGIEKNKFDSLNGYINVAVLDSGVDTNEDYNVCKRINLVKDEQKIVPYFEDLTGHGTSVVSIMTDINPNVRTYSLRVLDENNKGHLSEIVAGIYWCIDNNIQIINMSFGTKVDSEILHEAVREAKKAGILMIAAAGNGGEQAELEYPAAYDEVVSVGGVTQSGSISQCSSAGSRAELMGISEDVIVDAGFSQVGVVEGTSVAVPQVTAVAAALWGKDTDKSADFIRTLLQYSKQKNGVVNYEFASTHYKEFEKIYKAPIWLSAILKRDGAKLTDNEDIEFDARWSALYHKIALPESKLSDKEFRLIRRVQSLVDESSYPGKSRYVHALPYHNGENDLECNYIAVMRYLFRFARYLENGNSLAEAKEKARVMGDKSNQIENSLYKDIKYIVNTKTNFDSSIKKKSHLRAMKVLAMALHTAGDMYAHRTLLKTNCYPMNNRRDIRSGKMIGLIDFPIGITTGNECSILYKRILSGCVTQVLDYEKNAGAYSYADDAGFYSSRYDKGTKTAMKEMLNSWFAGHTTMSVRVINNRGNCEYSLHKSATYKKEAGY